MFNPNKPVRFDKPETGSAGGSEAVAPTPAPSTQGSVPAGTPPQGAPDAGQELQRLQQELAKRDQDLRNLKSTLQRQMAEQKRQWEEERKRMEEDLRRAQLASLDDDEREEFQKTLQLEEAKTWQQKAQEAQRRLEETQAMQSYTQFFLEQGVPPNKLVKDQGLDALVQSGWQGIQEMIQDLRAQLDALKSSSQPAVPQNTPGQSPQTRPPISAAQAPAGNGPTWEDLIRKYGSAEEVYRKVEMGMLPPSIIPTT